MPTRTSLRTFKPRRQFAIESMEPRCLLSVNPLMATFTPAPTLAEAHLFADGVESTGLLASLGAAPVDATPSPISDLIDGPTLSAPLVTSPNPAIDIRTIPMLDDMLPRDIDNLLGMETLIPEYDRTVDLLSGRDYALEFYNRGVVNFGSDYWGNDVGDYAELYGEGYAAASEGYNNALERREQQLLEQTGEEHDLNNDGKIGANSNNDEHSQHYDGEGGGFLSWLWDKAKSLFEDDEEDGDSKATAGITAESEGHMLTAFRDVGQMVTGVSEHMPPLDATQYTAASQARVFATWMR